MNTLESGRALQSAPSVAQAPSLASAPASSASVSSPFAALGLSAPLVRAVSDEGYFAPTPIQLKAIPSVAAGHDLLGSAQTGTGKTAAFVLPLLERLSRAKAAHGTVRALVLTPTRELAAQIGERTQAYSRYTKLRHTVIYGGVNQSRQERELARKPEIVIATPGRLLDLVQQRCVSLAHVEILVLDEADTMLDMGFIHDVRKIVAALPRQRQTLMFSATMPPDIEALARSVLTNPQRVAVAPVASTADTVEQSVHFVSKADKRRALEQLLKTLPIERALVFTRTKHGANRVSDQLCRAGIRAAAIHGNKSQGARERALGDFRSGNVPVLVATDIAARGIDVAGISHVINFDIPNVPETYVHRIGRAGRAGRSGVAISLCDRDERAFLADIERLIRRRVPVAQTEQLTAPSSRPTAPAEHSPAPAARPSAPPPVAARPPAPARPAAPARSTAPARSAAPSPTAAARPTAPAHSQAAARSSAPARPVGPVRHQAPVRPPAPARPTDPARLVPPKHSAAPARPQAPARPAAPGRSPAPHRPVVSQRTVLEASPKAARYSAPRHPATSQRSPIEPPSTSTPRVTHRPSVEGKNANQRQKFQPARRP